jgi:hypothetical protein
MEGTRVAPLVGIVGCLAVLVALAAPAVALEEGVGGYYGSGSVTPLAAGLLALVTVVVLAAGREERTDPGFAAGVAVVFGLAIVAILGLWAATVRLDAVAIDPNHRWATLAVALLVPAGAGWFARSLGLL